jgi:hypothetical protein
VVSRIAPHSWEPPSITRQIDIQLLRCCPIEPGIMASPGAKTTWTVEGVVAKLPGGTPVADSSSPVPFFHMLERLKTTKRKRWRRFGIPQYFLPNLLSSLNLMTSLLRVDFRPYVPHVAHYHVRTSLSILEDQCPTLHEDSPRSRYGRGACWRYHTDG